MKRDQSPAVINKYQRRRFRVRLGLLLLLVALSAGIVFVFWHELTTSIRHAFEFLSDREQIKRYVYGFGAGAPLVFMAVQILQVMLAPIPGEATGFVGGYLFGTLPGFVYSSIALALGSWVNFGIGRFLGKRYLRRFIPKTTAMRIEGFVRRQGAIILFFLFVLPGFPKDYLCLLLGVTTFPFKVFVIVSSLGRMPGTLMLSAQGASLYARNWGLLIGLTVGCIILGVLSYLYRERIYGWVERMNSN